MPLAIPPTLPDSTANGPPSVEISVLTYNVHGLPWPVAHHRKAELKAIGETLARLRSEGRAPDIVLIQEGFTKGAMALIRTSGYPYVAKGPGRRDRLTRAEAGGGPTKAAVRYRQAGEGWGKLASAGLYVLSDYPIDRVETRPYSACAGWDCLANKGAILAHIAAPGVPGGIDIANTHLNSKFAAKVPAAWSLQAYDSQLSQFEHFVDGHRDPSVPLIVGGDFNVKHAPDRYADLVGDAALTVVNDDCPPTGAACETTPDPEERSLWRDIEDLEAYSGAGPVAITPISAEMIFDARDTPRLSDHDGYLVRYRLTWTAPAAAG